MALFSCGNQVRKIKQIQVVLPARAIEPPFERHKSRRCAEAARQAIAHIREMFDGISCIPYPEHEPLCYGQWRGYADLSYLVCIDIDSEDEIALAFQLSALQHVVEDFYTGVRATQELVYVTLQHQRRQWDDGATIRKRLLVEARALVGTPLTPPEAAVGGSILVAGEPIALIHHIRERIWGENGRTALPRLPPIAVLYDTMAPLRHPAPGDMVFYGPPAPGAPEHVMIYTDADGVIGCCPRARKVQEYPTEQCLDGEIVLGYRSFPFPTSS